MSERTQDAVAIFGWMFLWSLFMWSVSSESTRITMIEECVTSGFVYQGTQYVCEVEVVR
jgi:hypothetical protein